MTMAPNGGAWRIVAEMCRLYPYLMEDVMVLQKEHPGLLKRQFLMIDDDKVHALAKNIKKQRVDEAKVNVRRRDMMKEMTNTLIDLLKSHTSRHPC
jgi:hypothetical protein